MRGVSRRRVLAVLAAGLLLAAASARLYGWAYPLAADNSGFAQAAEAYLSRGSEAPPVYDVEPQASLDIGAQRFILAELSDETDLSLGLFRLERGLNGRFRIAGCGWGGGSFRTRVVREGDRAYYLLGGRNRLLGIASASFTMEDDSLGRETYRLEIPAGDYFLAAAEIDAGFAADHEEPGSLRLCDGAGEDVTDRAGL